MENVGNIIKSIRKASGLTQRELASTMAVTQPYISLIERGIQTPTPMFIKLFRLLYYVDEDIFA